MGAGGEPGRARGLRLEGVEGFSTGRGAAKNFRLPHSSTSRRPRRRKFSASPGDCACTWRNGQHAAGKPRHAPPVAAERAEMRALISRRGMPRGSQPVEQAGPDLALHEHRHIRAPMVKEFCHPGGNVERHELMPAPGGSRSAASLAEVTVPVVSSTGPRAGQRQQHRQHGHRLAHTGGMDPDEPSGGRGRAVKPSRSGRRDGASLPRSARLRSMRRR